MELREWMLKKLKEILESEQQIDGDMDLVHYGLDSLKTIAFIVELEKQLGNSFDDDELLLENFSTINQIEKRVTEKCMQKNREFSIRKDNA